MTKGERERDDWNLWSENRSIDTWEEGIAYSLWTINNSLERLIKTIKEKKNQNND